MNMNWAKRRSNLAREDDGVALVAVIGLSAVIMLMIVTALSFSSSGMLTARTDQDSGAALAAAYAGVDEYASRLSNDSTYQKFGNPDAPFTIQTGSAPSVTMPPPSNPNPAFGATAGGTWASVAGTDGRASFRYEVDNSQYSGSGIVRVRSTGKVGNETRSLVANLKQSGFLNYVYFTVYEIMDPAITDRPGNTCTVGYAKKVGGTVKHNPNCTEIQFAADDTLDGKVHSNDILRICGSTFEKEVTSATTVTPNYVKVTSSGCGNPDFNLTFNPDKAPNPTGTIDPPVTNRQMANEARIDLPNDVPRPGCLYTGPTTITFKPNGKMQVVSPWTKFTNPSLTAGIASQNPAQCGSVSQLNTPAGDEIDVPDRNLIYVQSVPAKKPVGPQDPNYSATAQDSAFQCTASGSAAGWKLGTTQYPLQNEVVQDPSDTAVPTYGCTSGDAFVQGQVHGKVTIAAENFIFVTDDITYVDSGEGADMLGLVGNNAVWVWDPIVKECNGYGWNCTNKMLVHKTRVIEAAILSVAHTFQVQNYNLGGDRGTLSVYGSIAQMFRGTVGQGSDGYEKKYVYDERLLKTAPPKFLTPTSTTYGVNQYFDVATGFNADGSPR